MITSLRKRFGARVKQLRLAAEVSQEEFADRCGFARSYMSRIERGGANPSLDAIQVLADALGVEVAQLFVSSMIEARHHEHGKMESAEVMVPYAADGTCFHPGLASPRTMTFKVGEKTSPVRFDTFEEALEYLKGMKTAKWWRPNQRGTWGLVSAVRWGPLPSSQE